MLYDALLARSIDRYTIAKLLLDLDTDHAVDHAELSYLEAALRSTANFDLSMGSSSISEWRVEQKQSLRILQDLRGLGAQVPSNPQRLLLIAIAQISNLHLERALGQPRLAEWLIEQRVDINRGTYRKRGALWNACASNASESFIRLLIKKGLRWNPLQQHQPTAQS
ncbi:uncharacterized protein PG986_013841 [Apiospora aurea]|uniref:Uncharacterized protein n=1 Tax=Apiospora aurea TaxID=335848 RepID=A0ABR1PWR9_9PEZI